MRFLNSPKRIVWVWLVVAGLAFLPGVSQAAQEPADSEKNYGAAEARKAASRPERWITADHGDFEKLQQEFDSGPEVTKACLSCHNEAGKQMRETIHWTWICPADPSEQMGKAGVTLNNF